MDLSAEYQDWLDNLPDSLQASTIAERYASMTSATWRPWSRHAGLDANSRAGGALDWKTVSNNVLLVGLFVAMLTMFNQVNGRIDALNERLDTMQTENSRRFDEMQAEMSRRFDEMQAEMSRRFDEMNRRFDTLQAENQRQHDAMQEVLRVFEGRITRLEEKAGIDPGTDE